MDDCLHSLLHCQMHTLSYFLCLFRCHSWKDKFKIPVQFKYGDFLGNIVLR